MPKIINPLYCKYRFNEILNRMPLVEHRLANELIPKELGVSKMTWMRYRNCDMNSQFSIPMDHMRKLAVLFNKDFEELCNTPIKFNWINSLEHLEDKGGLILEDGIPVLKHDQPEVC